jgi:hypothetical protein
VPARRKPQIPQDRRVTEEEEEQEEEEEEQQQDRAIAAGLQYQAPVVREPKLLVRGIAARLANQAATQQTAVLELSRVTLADSRPVVVVVVVVPALGSGPQERNHWMDMNSNDS